VLAGDPGLGKSLLTINLAAKVTRGEIGRGAGNVLMLTAEDSLAHTVVPRLRAAGADLRRVRFASLCQDGFDTSILLPDNIRTLRRLLLAHEAALVVIDPLIAHLAAQINSWKDQTVRAALTPLHRLAEESGTAALVVAHLNKGQGFDPLQRLGGSIGIPAAARSVLLLARDPDDPDEVMGDQRVLAHVKSNLGELSISLALSIDASENASDVTVPRILDRGVSPYTGAQLLGTDRAPRGSKIAEAADFLRKQLSDGTRTSVDVEKAAKSHGISERTLKRARKLLGVESDKDGLNGGWLLSLPGLDLTTPRTYTQLEGGS
jgi:hypothetical protein